MPFQIVRNSITSMQVDAIVNPTDASYSGSGGTDAAIHIAAGIALDEACSLLPPLATGQTAVTPGYDLPCRYIIHTVGPIWRGGSFREEAVLASCYQNALSKALALSCESVAFPLISSGTFGFPKDRVLKIALEAIGGFLMSHDMNVWIVVYDKESFSVSMDLLSDIDAYIDDEYVDLHASFNVRPPFSNLYHSESLNKAETEPEAFSDSSPFSSAPFFGEDEDELFSPEPPAPARPDSAPPVMHPAPAMEAHAPSPFTVHKKHSAARKQEPSLYDDTITYLFSELDQGFSESLLKLIDQRGLTDVECYKKANIDKRLFSKIRSNPDYHPSKQTVLAFAIALRLSLKETQKLLETAGLALSRSSKFDLIVKYFITTGQYDIYEINEVLYHFDQPCLGNVML